MTIPELPLLTYKKCYSCNRNKPLSAFDGLYKCCNLCSLLRARPEYKAKKAKWQAEYNSRPENKAKKAEYFSRTEVRVKRVAYYSRPEVKAKIAEYQNRPEYKVKRVEYDVKYNSRPEIRAKQAEYKRRPEVRAKRAEYERRRRKMLRVSQSMLTSTLEQRI
jgi:hypothetical protein